MAYTAFSVCQNPTRVFYSNHNGGSPTLRWQGLKPRAIQINNSRLFRFDKTKKCILKDRKNVGLIPIFAADSDSSSVVFSVSDVITKFYACINDKNLKEIEEIISIDCFLEDSTFPHSFHGKKEVMGFISQVVESMGENVHFRTGTVCEGGDLIATLHWHLEWNKDELPFSRGCSIFQCSVEDDRLVIRKAQFIVESPFKPGEIGLGLLRILASFFDEFPKAAKWFLKSPHTIFMVVMHIYNLLVAPVMNPMLAFYIILWKLVVRLLGYVISILHFVAKTIIEISSNRDPTS
ncbi:hypothetical protein RND81_13G035100 [Saponaria officinalis]|uniref:SnoaL-like domain-containing protein n=1 Tax=Saponaria officinalis TaxID=3572 RepID=A0AAW1H012_SAPOF